MTDSVELVPVEKPDPKLIQELFDMDPLKLSDQDIDTMIAFYRSERMNYMQAPEEKKAKTKKAAVSAEDQAAAADLLSQLDL